MEKTKYLKRFVKEMKAVYVKKDNIHSMKIKSSKNSAEYARKVFPVDLTHKEAVMMIFLNNSNNTMGYSVVSTGGITGSYIDVRLVFQDAILANSNGIIMVHNHPSGNLKPSISDKNITKKIKDAGEILDIRLLDHIILTEDSYYSFCDNNEI